MLLQPLSVQGIDAARTFFRLKSGGRAEEAPNPRDAAKRRHTNRSMTRRRLDVDDFASSVRRKTSASC
jgi:hypothetical protein